jgi:Mn2+/Fe2+ NRAMP family transporter
VLAGSSAYAVAEGARWRASLDDRPARSPRFYAVIAAGMAGGLAIQWMHVDAVAMLVWSAVINGLLAPPLILLVVLLSSNREVMGSRANGPLLRALGWAAFGVMTAAAAGLVWFWIR